MRKAVPRTLVGGWGPPPSQNFGKSSIFNSLAAPPKYEAFFSIVNYERLNCFVVFGSTCSVCCIVLIMKHLIAPWILETLVVSVVYC